MSPKKESSDQSEFRISQIVPAVYDELRRRARYYLRGDKAARSLQPTALVHEAYMKLAPENGVVWQNRAHFCAIAAASMREILVDRARARNAAKRGGSRVRVTLGENLAAAVRDNFDLLALDESLTALAAQDAKLARIVELRFFGGLTIEECAESMNISPAAVKRGWSLAKAWLKRELQRGKSGE
jgi:RNA polymerase sigma factor (TIGR02999 family)